MKKNTITEAIGGIEDRFIAEAMDYKCERRITMSTKKVLIIAAIVALIACVAIPIAAEPSILFGRGENGEFIESGNYYESESGYPFDHYFGSLKDGTAAIAEEGSVEIIAVEAEEGIVKFVVNADTSVAPFDEYNELYVGSYMLYDAAGKMGHGSGNNPFAVFGHGYGKHRDKDLSYDSYVDDDFNFVFVKNTIGGVYPDPQQFKLVVYTISGRSPDGKIIEIRGEWEVEFMF